MHIAVHVDSIFGEMNIQLFFHSQTRTLIAIFHKNSARSRFESIRLDGDDQSAREDQLLRKKGWRVPEGRRHDWHHRAFVGLRAGRRFLRVNVDPGGSEPDLR